MKAAVALFVVWFTFALLGQEPEGNKLALCKKGTQQSECVDAPVLKVGMRPEYPENKTVPPGPVVLSVVIDTKGKPQGITVATSQGKDFDDAAIAALKQWRFEPARTTTGRKIPLRIDVKIDFPDVRALLAEALPLCSAQQPAPCAKYPPRPIFMPDPEYTDLARKNHVSGTCVLSVVVDTLGRVAYVKVKKSLGYGLDESSIEALRKWRLEPGRLEDKTAVPVKIEVETNFRMD
ncbi:MAG TPA: energy transducer TonB [Terriglobales bacterium]|nr:energy transducer TonB [Terriglobales bacterium]